MLTTLEPHLRDTSVDRPLRKSYEEAIGEREGSYLLFDYFIDQSTSESRSGFPKKTPFILN
jgi:hypothetical protein